jgi:hypothetical protein
VAPFKLFAYKNRRRLIYDAIYKCPHYSYFIRVNKTRNFHEFEKPLTRNEIRARKFSQGTVASTASRPPPVRGVRNTRKGRNRDKSQYQDRLVACAGPITLDSRCGVAASREFRGTGVARLLSKNPPISKD